jgi:hypothetical protein
VRRIVQNRAQSIQFVCVDLGYKVAARTASLYASRYSLYYTILYILYIILSCIISYHIVLYDMICEVAASTRVRYSTGLARKGGRDDQEILSIISLSLSIYICICIYVYIMR